jgi:hypothetical protein
MLSTFADYLTYTLLRIPSGTERAAAVQFFLYDSMKILLLLILITHAMSLLRFYLPMEKIKQALTSHKLYGADYFLATLFGALTPFCTCSSIPLFIGFLEAGIPLGVTLAFLITSPLINEVAVALFLGIFGWKITLLYVAAGIGIGMVGGMVLSRLRLERYVDQSVLLNAAQRNRFNTQSGQSVFRAVSRDAFSIVKSVTPYILLGVGVGALIHGFVPAGYFENYIQKENLLAVPVAVLLGVPLYANATGVIPIMESLIAKGVPLGTALTFMMAVVGLSLPEALILKRVMKLPLLLTFFGVVALGMMIIGYGFNFML